MQDYIINETDMTRTENGAAAWSTTGSDCLDLFAAIGALRGAQEQEIVKRFVRAWAEDPDMAMKILFFARDIRGGLGERRVFRVIMKWLMANKPASVRKNIALVPEYGRYDDLLCLLDGACAEDAIAVIRGQLADDMKALDEYAKTRSSAYGVPFENIVREFISPRQKEKLRNMIGFRFERHPRYNLPAARLKAIGKTLQNRVQAFLAV